MHDLDPISANGDQQSKKAPRTAYITLWFPRLSETFVFYEVDGLWKRHLPVSVISLYGFRGSNLSRNMLDSKIPIMRLGVPSILKLVKALVKRIRKEPKKSFFILKTLLFRHWRDLEMRLENYWACACGFYLADYCREHGIEHLHAAWASGPATAAWVVKQFEGIPYSFTARATDVRPPDGFLAEKVRDCAFARADSSYNIPHLASFIPEAMHDKIHLVYNTVTMHPEHKATVAMQPPYKLLAIGRLIKKKGFTYLVKAAKLLKDEGFPVKVTIVGSGSEFGPLKKEIEELALSDNVQLSGAMPHSALGALLCQSDMLIMPCIIPDGTEQSDGLPTVIIEAMCYGLPVISTDVASVGDVVKDGETGYLIAQKDTRALADAIKKMASHREQALQMAKNAESLIRDMFSENKTLLRMRELFITYTP